MPFIMRQQVQPAFIMAVMQSQQAWHISQHLASPLMQVMQQPSSVVSQRQLHMQRLQLHIIMPFMVQQRVHIPPASDMHMFCIMLVDIASSHSQVIFIPPLQCSSVILQRGTIIPIIGELIIGEPIDMPLIIGLPIMPLIVPAAGIIIVFIIESPFFVLLAITDLLSPQGDEVTISRGTYDCNGDTPSRHSIRASNYHGGHENSIDELIIS